MDADKKTKEKLRSIDKYLVGKRYDWLQWELGGGQDWCPTPNLFGLEHGQNKEKKKNNREGRSKK